MSRGIGYVEVSTAGGSRRWTVEEVTPSVKLNEKSASEVVTFYLWETVTGAAPPPVPDAVSVKWKDPNGSTVGNQYFTSVAQRQAGSTANLQYAFMSDPRNRSGNPRAGTLELVISMFSQDTVAPYDVSSDTRDPQTVSPGQTIFRDRHWQRANCAVDYKIGLTSAINNTSVISYGDNVWVLATPAVPLFGTAQQPVALRRTDTSSNITSTTLSYTTGAATSSGQFTSFVSNAFPAARVGLTLELSSFVSPSVSGSPAMVPTSSTLSQAPDADARVSLRVLMQHNDNVFGSPPSIKDKGSVQRLTSDLSFLTTRATNARAEGVDNLSLTRNLYDIQQLVGTPTSGVVSRTDTTKTLNGEAGWLDTFITWSQSLPGGGWRVRHTTGGNANGLLTPADVPLTLVSADPNLVCVTAGGPGTPVIDSRHFSPGEPLVVGLSIFHIGRNEIVPADEFTPRVMIARFNLATGQAEVLQPDNTWKPAQVSENNVYHALSETFPGSRVYIKIIPGTETANWTVSDIFSIGKAEVLGVPVVGYLKEITVGKVNNHTKYQTDGRGMIGFPSR